jgi:hypothetical protein
MRTAPSVAAAVALTLAPVTFAQGTVWRCTDSDGRAHYTNIKKDTEGRSCQVVTKEVSVVPAGQTPVQAANRSAAAQTPTPANFPRVDRETQKARDDGRRRILEDELATEEKSLADAKARLTEQESVRLGEEKNYQRVLDRLKPYQDAVERHERNVSALRREIANLR